MVSGRFETAAAFSWGIVGFKLKSSNRVVWVLPFQREALAILAAQLPVATTPTHLLPKPSVNAAMFSVYSYLIQRHLKQFAIAQS
jgi:hypothetical protein